MATLTRIVATCDVCGDAEDVQTWTFGLDDKTYEIDLCPKDGKGLSKLAAGYVEKARKATARQSPRSNGHRSRRARSEPKAAAVGNGKAKGAGAGEDVKAGGADPRKANGRAKPQKANGRAKPQKSASRADTQKADGRAKPQKAASRAEPKEAAGRAKSQQADGRAKSQKAASRTETQRADGRAEPRKAEAASAPAAESTGVRERKGIYVYGILPGDIEMAGDMPGVGDHPGPLRVVRKDGLAALISEVGLPGRLGSPDDRRTHRQILNATAVEVPVLPLRFGAVLSSAEAVAELLAAHHDVFADALAELEDRAEFVVKGRYAKDAILSEIQSENNQAARLQEHAQGQEPDAAGDATTEHGDVVSEAAAAMRTADTRALREAMKEVCVASTVRKPAHELDAVNVAFLVAVDDTDHVERVVQDLAQKWEGRIELRLLGPMAAYDFVTISRPG